MKDFKQFIKTTIREFLNESVNNNFDENRKNIRPYIKIITKSDDYQNGYRIDDGGYDDGRHQKKYNIYDHWVKYLIIIHNSLLIEEKFQNEFKVNSKEINKYLKLPNTTNFDEIIKLCQDYYDPKASAVRFGIETKDSIEEVRIYLKELSDRGIKFYDKIYFSF